MDFSGITALVIGDAMLDHYIVGEAKRVSPEAPVPVVARQRSWTVPGGAANVARGLARLGVQSRLTGLVGSDAAGETLRKEVGAEGIKSGLITASSRPTTCKTRIMAHGQQLLRLDEEVAIPPNQNEKLALRLSMEKNMAECDVVILSDYAKGVLAADKSGRGLCEEVIALATVHGIPVLVDPKGTDWEKYSGAQCITPNFGEFAKICQRMGHGTLTANSDLNTLRDLAESVRAKFNIERILLTRGAKGMILFESGRPPLNVRAVMREVADVSGAGDTVIATLGACVGKHLSWNEGAEIANVAAGLAVSKPGTAPVDIGELNIALRESSHNPKLYSPEELVQKIQEWRSQGQRIVFTNGCFDLLHPGHISLLRQSASFGDRLIVGLNSDASVRRLKGPSRPIQNGDSRALLLAAIRFVDAVTFFDEDTPEELIKLARPDVLVKGSDYSLENVVGASFVQSYGGKVRLVDLVDGYSTTSIEQKLRRQDN